MEYDEVLALRRRFWRKGAASLQEPRLADVWELIGRHRPRGFVEIGTATGLTTALVARMMEDHGGERVVTVDLSERFYTDDSLETGFVIPEAYPSGPVRIDRHVGMTSLDVSKLGLEFEMGLVDGNHFHPWPLLDTLCLYPLLTGPRILIHDDLNLFRRGQGRRIGPKYVWDQFPESRRTRLGADGNMFVLDLDLDRDELERIATDGLRMPWTSPRRLTPEQVDALRGVIATHYSTRFAAEVDQALERFEPAQDKT